MTPPMSPEEVAALADRVEAAKGPDRELDSLIWLYVTPGATREAIVIPATENRRGWTIDETREASGRLIVVPRFTGSLDAAMALVPEGLGPIIQPGLNGIWHARMVRININTPQLLEFRGKAATPALTLTAASLRAHHLRKGQP